MSAHILKEMRRKSSLTQLELAEKLGKPQSFVSKYESGERRVDIDEFIAICQALDLKPSNVIQMIERKPVNEF